MNVDLSFLGAEARAELEHAFQLIAEGVKRGTVDDLADARALVRRAIDLHQRDGALPPSAADPSI